LRNARHPVDGFDLRPNPADTPAPDWWRDRWCLLWLLVALVVRIAYSSQLTGLERSDPIEYDAIAWNAAQGVGFTNRGLAPHESWVRRPPGFPALLAAVYVVFGHDLFAARMVQCVVGVLLCAVTCALAASLANLRTVRAVAAAAALYPYLIYYCGYLMSENLASLLFCTALWWISTRGASLAADLLGGVLLGLAGLTRSLFLGFVAPLALWLVSSEPKKSTAAARWAVVVLGALLVVSPWIVRNHRLTGKLILQADSVAGFYRWHLWFSQDDFWEHDSWRHFNERNPELFTKLRGLPDVELDEALSREAMHYVVSDPVRYLRSCVRKFLWFWRPSTFAFAGAATIRSAAFWISFGAYVVWLPAFAHGLVRLWRLGPSGRLLVWAVVYVTAFHTFYWYGSPRFRFPIYPMFLIACCLSVENVWSRMTSRTSGGQRERALARRA
jgi:4-amino-4-deoxy-L-arabinose transferase-like glycosyltransferase